MPLPGFSATGLNDDLLAHMLEEHAASRLPRLDRLWSYYRNPMRERVSCGADGAAGRAPGAKPYHLAQEAGLPARLRGMRAAGSLEDPVAEKEIVIENDIAWRIDTLVDFAFGKPVRIVSTARDAGDRRAIERILDAVWEASGGAPLVQDMGLLGMVHGSIDLILRADALFAGRDGSEGTASPGVPAGAIRGPGGAPGGAAFERALDAARLLRVELVEAPRAIPLLNPGDYRRIEAYIIRTERETMAVEREGFARRILGAMRHGGHPNGRSVQRGRAEVLEILSPTRRLVRRDGAIVSSGENPLGVLPVVHVQNASQPYRYEGLSDVEPLIPLQDELNTRLSDRAHRVTMQSFNMYLVKGLELHGAPAIGPSRIWTTDNADASIQSFGGDGASPSEDAHIEQLRDAMDKSSAVSPVAIGVVREKLGHLSSENALRITLAGVLNKTARRRLAYGHGVAAMCGLILHALDRAGVFRTLERDRAVRLEWQDALPVDERERLAAARMKLDLGVARERVLSEIGYGTADTGVA